MYKLSVVSATAALLTPDVVADWYMYATYYTSSAPELGASTEYHFFEGPPDCNDAGNSPIFTSTSDGDVSGTKYGICCDGCDPYNVDIDISEVEINLENWGHYSKSIPFVTSVQIRVN